MSASQLNRWLEHMLEKHPPPFAKGKRIKLRYMTLVKFRPPTFSLFMSGHGADLGRTVIYGIKLIRYERLSSAATAP
ncbi:MAG: hypothetical protein V7750_17145 [Sneathiella sp.]